MKVSDIMTPAAVTDAPDDTLAEASAKMWRQQTGSLLVMEGDRLTGIVTERDVLRHVGEGGDPKSAVLRDVMTADPVTISPDTPLHEAARIMFEKWFRHLPVVTEKGEVLGIISLRDLLTLVARGMEEPETLRTLTGHTLVRDARLQRIEAGDLD
ncbi:MAG TPA: CBS domain-containing protein [Actinomycetota bacterium]|jgi:CBS domain-containing protein|nr:CBS domain-containing protein [Actinomycetota bacterium]